MLAAAYLCALGGKHEAFGQRQGQKTKLVDDSNGQTAAHSHMKIERAVAVIVAALKGSEDDKNKRAREMMGRLMNTDDELSAVPSFKFCGQRWLQHNFGIHLALVEVAHPVAAVGQSINFVVHGLKHEQTHGHEHGDGGRVEGRKRAKCKSADFDLWARAVGPAVVMGEVSSDTSTSEKANSCEWKVTFKLPVAGNYEVEVMPVWWTRGGSWATEKVYSTEQCELTEGHLHSGLPFLKKVDRGYFGGGESQVHTYIQCFPIFREMISFNMSSLYRMAFREQPPRLPDRIDKMDYDM